MRTADADRRYQLLAFRILGEFGAAIAVPAVAAAMVGKRLDAAAGTSPRWLLILLALAFAATALYVTRRAKAYAKEYEEIESSHVESLPSPNKPDSKR